MAWDDAPPTKDELSATNWMDAPPTVEELSASSNTTPSPAESFLRGAANQFGAAPKLMAAVQQPVGAAKALYNVSPLASVASLLGLNAQFPKSDENLQNYNKAKALAAVPFNKAEKAHPYYNMAGNVAASLPLAALAPEMAGLSAAARGLGTGATYGALNGLGKSDSENFTDLAKQVIPSTLIGAGVGGAVGKVAGALSPSALEQTAAQRAVKATGANKAQMTQLLKAPTAGDEEALDAVQKTLTDPALNDDDAVSQAISLLKAPRTTRLQEQGQNLLKQNPYQEQPVVTPLSTPEDILERAQDLQQKSGQDIGNILNKLDNKFGTATITKDFYNPQTSVDKLVQLQKQLELNGQPAPLLKTEYNKLQDAIDTLKGYGNQPISFGQAQKIQKLFSDAAYNDKGELSDQLMAKARAIINDDIEDSADDVAEKANNPALYDQYKTAKDYYRTAKDAVNAAQGKTAANLVNRDLGITDYMSAASGAAVHGVPGAAVAAVGNKLAKTYGNSLAATSAEWTADKLRTVNKALTSMAPAKLSEIGRGLMNSGDDLSMSLGRVLDQASKKDDIGRNAVIFSLLQNPAYRSVMAGLSQQQE